MEPGDLEIGDTLPEGTSIISISTLHRLLGEGQEWDLMAGAALGGRTWSSNWMDARPFVDGWPNPSHGDSSLRFAPAGMMVVARRRP